MPRLRSRLRLMNSRKVWLYFVLPLLLTSVMFTPIVLLVLRREISVEFLTKPCAFGLIALSGLAGNLRGVNYHPVFDLDYWAWLARTPWRRGYPLPKGPIALGRFDLLAVSVLTIINGLLALTITMPYLPLVLGPACAYVLGVVVAWSCANQMTGLPEYTWYVLVVPLAFALLGVPLIGYMACPILMLAVARIGVNRSLEDFPWPEALDEKRRRDKQVPLGWPMQNLSKEPDKFPMPLQLGAPISTFVACWIWVFASASEASPEPPGFYGINLILVLASFVAALIRLSLYGSTICNHLCFGLRCARKQWFIAEHDRILVAPLLMIVSSLALPGTLLHLVGLPDPVSLALAGGVVCLIGLTMGPNTIELFYTGVHSKFGGKPSGADKAREFVVAGQSTSAS